MEQKSQERVRPAEETRKPEEQTRRTPERERLLSDAGRILRAASEGASLLEMPPVRLEKLAALVGNQGMAALLEGQSLPAEELPFSLPPPLETAPFPVPDTGPVPIAEPPALTGGAPAGRAFDPAGLIY